MTAAARQDGAAPDGRGLADCRVLVVEDHEGARALIGAVLQAGGIANVEYAGDGIEALERLEGGFKPDLVILDIMMPRMDGFALCRRLRDDDRFRRLPILVQTALGAPEERTEVFRAGATDVVPKPIHGPELIARVHVHLQNAVLLRSLEAYRRRVEEELDLSRAMQEDLLPPLRDIEDISRRHHLTLESRFQTSSELGGDYWGIEDLGEDRIGVFIVDFTGHGVTAALNTFRLHTLMSHLRLEESPGAYLGTLNQHLKRLMQPGHFATFLYGIVDRQSDTFTYASAGAPSPIVGANGEVRLCDSRGLPLGITENAEYENRSVSFPPGAFLLLYSDALIESPDADGAVLEPGDLVEIARACAGTANGTPLAMLMDRFHDKARHIADDLTAVWLSRKG